MAKQDITKFFDKVKKTTEDVSHTINDKAKDIADSLAKRWESRDENDGLTREEEVSMAMEGLKDTVADRLLSALGESPTALTKANIAKLRGFFPIPREQCILWADAEFDLRPSGIVCTDVGLFIKNDVKAFEKKKGNPDGDEKDEHSVLLYYKWEEFEPAWFTADDPVENRALTVAPQCSERFVTVCRMLAERSIAAEKALADISYNDSELEEMVAKIASVELATMQSAQNSIFIEQNSAIRNPSGGHGNMAEEALTLLDRLHGKSAVTLGNTGEKNGPDRCVNGVYIQTKYHKSAQSTFDACFEHGTYRYMRDGKPMPIEVPKDQYEYVLERVRREIEKGNVPGVSDPNEAERLVRKGLLTHEQAKNLTKAGTIESLTYDALTGAVICTCTFGITFVTTAYLNWRKSGDISQAVKAGAMAGVQVFGITFIQHMLVSQLARTNLINVLAAPSRFVVGSIGFKSSALLVNGIRALSGRNAIYGAVSKHLETILRSNMFTSAMTFAIFSVPDTYRLTVNKISKAQYTKNISVLAGSMVGGAGGAIAAGIATAKIAGAAGTAVAPVVGTIVGITGGFVGGMLGAKAVGTVGNIIREDDVVILGRLFNAVVSCMVGEYLFDADEIDKLIKRLDEVSPKEFKELFGKVQASEHQEAVMREFLTPHMVAIAKERITFLLPSEEKVIEAIAEDYLDVDPE